MRKIILSMNITEDGFIAGPNGELDWHFPYWNLQMCESLCRELSKADTILLGRKTYSAFAEYWPAKGTERPITTADMVLLVMMNRYTKIVVSKTLKTLPWINSFFIEGDILSGTKQLKQKAGKNIIIFGSSSLVAYLIKHNLIDEYCLWVHPIMIGKGKLLKEFEHLKCKEIPIDVEHFSSGVIKLCYLGRNKKLVQERERICMPQEGKAF